LKVPHNLEIIPLASDSLGVRSMATFVKTPDISILIDPGVALGPWRLGLSPHKREIERLGALWCEVKKKFDEAEVIFITHYHYDHLNPQEPELFSDKTVFLKDPKNTNKSQRMRGEKLLEKFKTLGVRFEIADRKTFQFGKTLVRFSPALPHGREKNRGMVLMVSIIYQNSRFVFSSDIEGIPRRDQLDFLIEENPNFLYLDGPPTYLLGNLYHEGEFKESLEHMAELIEKTTPEMIIFDHHLLRDRNWKDRVSALLELGEKYRVEIKTVANFLGKKEELLEAMRKALYYQGF